MSIRPTEQLRYAAHKGAIGCAPVCVALLLIIGSAAMSLLSPEMFVLLASAASVGFLHTLLGPDHYLPFVSMALEQDSHHYLAVRLRSHPGLCAVGRVRHLGPGGSGGYCIHRGLARRSPLAGRQCCSWVCKASSHPVTFPFQHDKDMHNSALGFQVPILMGALIYLRL